MGTSVSVALCTHNGAPYIEAQLQSILAQSEPPSQIVLSDDASGDDTIAIATRVMSSAAASGIQLTLLSNPIALGVTANFEQAIRACTGTLIALSDQDDTWHENRLAVATTLFAAKPELELVFADAQLVSASGDSLAHGLFQSLEVSPGDLEAIHAGSGFELFIRRNVATGATVMFRSRLLDVALPFPADWVHDGWLATLASILDSIDALEEKIIDYRQHGANQIGVAYPTLARKIARTLMPRGDRNARLARMFAQLAERVEATTAVPADRREIVRKKAIFEADREALPDAVLRRIVHILRIDRGGAYARYASQGRIDMIRDLLQPHR
jgi:glycosyltransferase involved in cell wall biosynthesis